MSAAKAKSGDTLDRWKQRMLDLGLNPDIDGVNIRIIRHTDNLAEYKKWWAFPENPSAPVNDVKASRIADLPDDVMRRYVSDHISNRRVINDPDAIKALEKRYRRFALYVQAAPDLTITAADPLIINTTGVITLYNNVTIESGGYIKITIPCKFECQNLTKIQGSGTSAFDVYAVGIDGTSAAAGTTPQAPAQAQSGKNATCNCCNTEVNSRATAGANGADGAQGGDAPSNGTDGGNGPLVFFNINESLTGTLSFLNQGGNGGNGGTGGNGAQGGQGGNGGNGAICGAFEPDGKAGGNGGQGGNGGNGSNGGNGGKGGTLTITVPTAAVTSVLVTNAQAAGGGKGSRGIRGQGGLGGNAGAQGGSPGNPGPVGDSDGNEGLAGIAGDKGSATVNGNPVV